MRFLVLVLLFFSYFFLSRFYRTIPCIGEHFQSEYGSFIAKSIYCIRDNWLISQWRSCAMTAVERSCCGGKLPWYCCSMYLSQSQITHLARFYRAVQSISTLKDEALMSGRHLSLVTTSVELSKAASRYNYRCSAAFKASASRLIGCH
ncbi:uncharacterized protein BDW70DRAFT_77548 [Aspergillus foveolatus]|uniref:uncharacterized protein n=1 Tax=Aspergillus foveolatus TaxID=210207 RepID=UPI003CCE3668